MNPKEFKKPEDIFLIVLAVLLFVIFFCSDLFADIYMPAIAQIESSYRPRAVSYKGKDDGVGLYQISDITRRDFNNYHDTNY